MINSTRSIEKGNGRKDRAKEMQFCDSKLHPTPRSTNKNTNKARIVCNSSPKAKKGKKSLNECIYQGPFIFEDLCILLR